MYYITHTENGRIAYIGDKRPISYSDNLELIEVENVPSYNQANGEYLTVENGELVVNENPAFIRRKQISELKSWFNNEYRYYAEKLTRFQALNIVGTITDEKRHTTYTSLLALYDEAEVVRGEINELEGNV